MFIDTYRAMSLLREYLSEFIIIERIRSKSFNRQHLESLESVNDVYEYVTNSGLREIGRGGGRAVFLLNSSKVLKIAIPNEMTGEDDDFGREQNESEFMLSQNPIISGGVAKTFEHGPNFEWIIAELVRPIDGSKEFQELIGAPVGMKTLVQAIWQQSLPEFKRFVEKNGLNVQRTHGLLAALRSMKKMNVNVHDIQRLEHWGKTVDGRLVILDYGLVDPDYSNE